MMQIVLVVMAISLAALLVAGGASYLSTDVGVRIGVAQGLMTQHESLASGIATYRTANNGMMPPSVPAIRPYLVGGAVPQTPRGTEGLEWTMAKPDGVARVLCLRTKANAPPLDEAVATGVLNFARDAAARLPEGTVLLGLDCGVGNPTRADFSRDDFDLGRVAVTFRDN